MPGMRIEDLKKHEVYIVAGRGPMFLLELPGGTYEFEGRKRKKTTITFVSHGNFHYWAGIEEVVRPCTKKLLQEYMAQARARRVDCRDPTCWCVTKL